MAKPHPSLEYMHYHAYELCPWLEAHLGAEVQHRVSAGQDSSHRLYLFVAVFVFRVDVEPHDHAGPNDRVALNIELKLK